MERAEPDGVGQPAVGEIPRPDAEAERDEGDDHEGDLEPAEEAGGEARVLVVRLAAQPRTLCGRTARHVIGERAPQDEGARGHEPRLDCAPCCARGDVVPALRAHRVRALRRVHDRERHEGKRGPEHCPHESHRDHRAQPRKDACAAPWEEHKQRADSQRCRRHVRQKAALHLAHSLHRDEARDQRGEKRVKGQRLRNGGGRTRVARRMCPVEEADLNGLVVGPVCEHAPADDNVCDYGDGSGQCELQKTRR